MSSGKAPQRGQIALLILTTAVLASVLIAPFTLPGNTVDGLSGEVGVIDNDDAINAMNPLARAVYYAGDLITDQLSDNSYYLNGNQMPFSSRIMGLFFGLMWGAFAAAVIRPKTRPRVLLGVVPMLVDWSLQFTNEYVSTNMLRLITGVVAGIVLALFTAAAFSSRLEPDGPAPSKPPGE